MKQLTCDLCEGTKFVKQDGFFICQDCGTKYSLEEARKMMREVDGTPAAPSAPAAPAAPNNSAVVENYLKMAESALESSNNSEAETYANKILELAPDNAKAWEIKGKAAGWQSKTNNNRIPEAVNAFMMAVEYAADEDKAEMRNSVGLAFRSLGKAMISLYCDNFGNLPDDDHASKVTKCVEDVIELMNDLVVKSAVGFSRGSFYNDIARMINNAACDGFKEAKSDFGPEHRNMAKWQWERFTGRCDACLTMLDKAIVLVRENELGKQICENYKTIGQTARDSCSWKFNVNSWNADNYDRDYSFTDGAKNARTKAINDFLKNKNYFNTDRIAATTKKLSGSREQAELDAGREKYWEEHAKEKADLTKRSEEIKAEVEEIKKSLNALDKEYNDLKGQLNGPVPAMNDKNSTLARISGLNAELKSLGLFKGKEKKAIRAQIEELESTLPQLDAEISKQTDAQNAPINAKLDEVSAKIRPLSNKRTALDKELSDIKTELTKSRGKISTAGKYYLKDSMVDGKFNITCDAFIEHLKTVIPSNYVLSTGTNEKNKISSHLGICRKYIVTDKTIAGDNKNSGVVLFIELEPGSDTIRTIMVQGPKMDEVSDALSWTTIGTRIVMSLTEEAEQGTVEEIFADLAFSAKSTWYGEKGVSIEFAEYVLLSLGTVSLRSSCAVIRPD